MIETEDEKGCIFICWDQHYLGFIADIPVIEGN